MSIRYVDGLKMENCEAEVRSFTWEVEGWSNFFMLCQLGMRIRLKVENGSGKWKYEM